MPVINDLHAKPLDFYPETTWRQLQFLLMVRTRALFASSALSCAYRVHQPTFLALASPLGARDGRDRPKRPRDSPTIPNLRSTKFGRGKTVTPSHPYAPGDYLKVEFRDDDGVMDRRVNLLRSIPKRHLDAGDGPTISTSRKIDFERTIRRTKKPPARAGGFVQFANKVLIALP